MFVEFSVLSGRCDLVRGIVKAKFHYAIWSQTGSKLVADRFEAGRGPVADLLARASSLLAS